MEPPGCGGPRVDGRRGPLATGRRPPDRRGRRRDPGPSPRATASRPRYEPAGSWWRHRVEPLARLRRVPVIVSVRWLKRAKNPSAAGWLSVARTITGAYRTGCGRALAERAPARRLRPT